MTQPTNSSKSAGEPRFSVHYRIVVNGQETIDQLAGEIAIEQTAEAPIDCIPKKLFENGIIGHVEEVTAATDRPKTYNVVISYRCDITDFTIPQLLNVIFGNISLKNNIKVIALDFPEFLLKHFLGPSQGIDGIRKMLRAFDRPLACTPLKPLGLSVTELSALAAAFARGGVDIIKDDHGISNQPFHPFRERVSRCQEAIVKENARSGRTTVYCPMVSGRFEEIEAQVSFAKSLGVGGILIAPMLVGFDTVRYLSEKYGGIFIAHPSLTGTFFNSADHGMTPAVLLGTLFRLIGADISVFPNAGGRFFFTKEECGELAEALRAPLGHIKRAFPCPAGGISLDKIGELMHYGADTVFLIGGSLLQRSSDIAGSTMAFMERIGGMF
jgi:ribulose-bisphosphate carboxylase large chain